MTVRIRPFVVLSVLMACLALLPGCPPAPCTVDAECVDGEWCNGTESCDAENGNCVPGEAPCPQGIECDEEGDFCIECGR